MSSANDLRVSGIYLLTFSRQDTYLGASKNVHDRVLTHLSWLRSKKGQNAALQAAFDRYGPPVVTLMSITEPQNLQIMEHQFWLILKPNLSKPPTKGGIAGATVSDLARRNMSLGAKGRTDQMKQSARQLQTWADPEIRARRVASMRGVAHTKRSSN